MAAITGNAANCFALAGMCAVDRTCFTVNRFLPALHHRITAKEVLQKESLLHICLNTGFNIRISVDIIFLYQKLFR